MRCTALRSDLGAHQVPIARLSKHASIVTMQLATPHLVHLLLLLVVTVVKAHLHHVLVGGLFMAHT